MTDTPILTSAMERAKVRARALTLRNTLNAAVRLLRGEHVWPGELPKPKRAPLPPYRGPFGRPAVGYRDMWPEDHPEFTV